MNRLFGEHLPPHAGRIALATAAAAFIGGLSLLFFRGSDTAPDRLTLDETVKEATQPTVDADLSGDDLKLADALDEGGEASASAPVRTSAALETSLCLPKVLRTESGCAPLSDLKEEGQAFLAADALPTQPVQLIGPGDATQEPRVIDSCATYGELRRAGWEPLSSADMRRAARFSRACGVLIMAERAVPVPSAKPLAREDVMDFDRATLPFVGERPFGNEARVSREGEYPQVWVMENETMACHLSHVITADFNSDGTAEHLFEWRLAAKGGSLRDQGFGMAKRLGPSRVTFQIVDPFTE